MIIQTFSMTLALYKQKCYGMDDVSKNRLDVRAVLASGETTNPDGPAFWLDKDEVLEILRAFLLDQDEFLAHTKAFN